LADWSREQKKGMPQENPSIETVQKASLEIR
jgi:hypothetical protein